jgi:hypothetical protein
MEGTLRFERQLIHSIVISSDAPTAAATAATAATA